jgi:hypothetical protein
MSGKANILPELTRALGARGFTYAGRTSEGLPRFKGRLTAANADHAARVAVDLTGQELPRVHVDLPPGAPAVIAHVGANGFVCYAAKGSLVLDIFDIPGQTLACLDRAATVLDLALRGEMQQDLEDEFFAFWGGELCFLDVGGEDKSPLSVLHFEEAGLAFLTNRPERTQKKLRAMQLTGGTETSVVAGFLVNTTAKPKPSQGMWPPGTVADLLRWQELLDPHARREMERQLLRACVRRKLMALCVVKSPVMQYAFWVSLATGQKQSPAKALATARPRLLAAKVYPMSAVRIDDEYVSRRNAPGRPTLAGKRVALVGCGTIGGFLAELLVKAGAGLDGGELLLIDSDILMPQNVGRHRLGLNYALKNKAAALKTELSAGAPTANLRDLPVKVQEAELGALDLLIDATGEEALSALLTRQFTDSGVFVPTLTTWVEGPGVAVRGLLRDAERQGCTRCMSEAHGQPLFPVVDGAMPDDLAGHGCESLYVPFPATVSVQAACLAADMISDWLGHATAPRLRTTVTRRGFTKATQDTDVPRRATCPACSS